MHRIFYLISFIVLLSCSSSKNYLQQGDGDKALFDALDKLDKKPNSKKAIDALPTLYANAQKRYLEKIAAYGNQQDINRWQGILDAYDVLQRMYIGITSSFVGGKLVKPVNYHNDIHLIKKSAAEDYYQLGILASSDNSREGVKKTWRAFKKANELVPGYKDTESKIEQLNKEALTKVAIAPVKNNAGQKGAAVRTSNAITSEMFDEFLVGTLRFAAGTQSEAIFYTTAQASNGNITPDWTVALTLTDLSTQGPNTDSYTYRESNRIITGYDSTRTPITTDVDAQVTKYTQRVRVTMEIKMDIIEVATGKQLSSRKYPEAYNWQNEYATYSGDAMALSSHSSTLINRRGTQSPQPNIDAVCNSLYNKICQKIKDKILLTLNEYQNQ